ncbi:hypothetical protein HDU92_002915 [Lobulomyces angularis]|nr:hypothetical protein HDU92_002915 [Lobulomyces angularis]
MRNTVTADVGFKNYIKCSICKNTENTPNFINSNAYPLPAFNVAGVPTGSNELGTQLIKIALFKKKLPTFSLKQYNFNKCLFSTSSKLQYTRNKAGRKDRSLASIYPSSLKVNVEKEEVLQIKYQTDSLKIRLKQTSKFKILKAKLVNIRVMKAMLKSLVTELELSINKKDYINSFTLFKNLLTRVPKTLYHKFPPDHIECKKLFSSVDLAHKTLLVHSQFKFVKGMKISREQEIIILIKAHDELGNIKKAASLLNELNIISLDSYFSLSAINVKVRYELGWGLNDYFKKWKTVAKTPILYSLYPKEINYLIRSLTKDKSGVGLEKSVSFLMSLSQEKSFDIDLETVGYLLSLSVHSSSPNIELKLKNLLSKNNIENFEHQPLILKSMMTNFFQLYDKKRALETFEKILKIQELQHSKPGLNFLTECYEIVIKGLIKLRENNTEIFSLFEKAKNLNDLNLGIIECLIKIYSREKNFSKIKETFSLIKFYNLLPNERIFTLLINSYTNLEGIDWIRNVFLTYWSSIETYNIYPSLNMLCSVMRAMSLTTNEAKVINVFENDITFYEWKRDKVSYNIIINMFVKRKNEEKSLLWLKKMLDSKITPDLSTYNIILQLFYNSFNREGVLRLLTLIRRDYEINHANDPKFKKHFEYTKNIIANRFKFTGRSHIMKNVIMESNEEFFAFNHPVPKILGSAAYKKGDDKKFYVSENFSENPSKPESDTLGVNTSEASKSGEGGDIVNAKFADKPELNSNIPNFADADHSQFEFVGYNGAEKKLLNMEKKSIISYTPLLRHYAKQKMIPELLELTKEVASNGKLRLDVTAYYILMKAYKRTGNFNSVITLFESMINEGFEPTAAIFDIVIRSYIQLNDIESALNVVRHVEEIHEADTGLEDLCEPPLDPLISSQVYNQFVNYWLGKNNVEAALVLINEMRKLNYIPGLFALRNTVVQLARDNDPRCLKFFLLFIEEGHTPSVYMVNFVLTNLANNKNCSGFVKFLETLIEMGWDNIDDISFGATKMLTRFELESAQERVNFAKCFITKGTTEYFKKLEEGGNDGGEIIFLNSKGDDITIVKEKKSFFDFSIRKKLSQFIEEFDPTYSREHLAEDEEIVKPNDGNEFMEINVEELNLNPAEKIYQLWTGLVINPITRNLVDAEFTTKCLEVCGYQKVLGFLFEKELFKILCNFDNFLKFSESKMEKKKLNINKKKYLLTETEIRGIPTLKSSNWANFLKKYSYVASKNRISYIREENFKINYINFNPEKKKFDLKVLDEKPLIKKYIAEKKILEYKKQTKNIDYEVEMQAKTEILNKTFKIHKVNLNNFRTHVKVLFYWEKFGEIVEVSTNLLFKQFIFLKINYNNDKEYNNKVIEEYENSLELKKNLKLISIFVREVWELLRYRGAVQYAANLEAYWKDYEKRKKN